MKKITLMGGIACMALSLMFLSSCKKEEITSNKPVTQSEKQEGKPHEFKFSDVAQIQGENPSDGFLSLKISSDDQKSLDEYIAKLKKCKLTFKEADPSSPSEEKLVSLIQSKAAVSMDFDWSNYHSNLPKGKVYECLLTSNDQTKALTLQYTWTVSSFTSTSAFACINIYATDVYNTLWYLGNGTANFYSCSLAYHDNMEVRSLTTPTSPGTGFGAVTYNGTNAYYRPRLNYNSVELPATYTDFGVIRRAAGYSTFTGNAMNSDIRLYLAS